MTSCITLSEAQKRTIAQIQSGDGLIPALTYHKLSEMGLVTKTGQAGAGRGKTFVALTDKGRQIVL